MRILLFLLMIFILAGLIIISNNSLALSEKENVKEFSELYVGWLDNLYNNVLTITGEVTKLSWVPESGTG